MYNTNVHVMTLVGYIHTQKMAPLGSITHTFFLTRWQQFTWFFYYVHS